MTAPYKMLIRGDSKYVAALLLLLAFFTTVIGAESSKTPVARRDLLQAFEKSWKDAVLRTQREINELRSAAAHVATALSSKSAFAAYARKRATKGEEAIAKNAEFVSRVLDAEPPCVERLWEDDDDADCSVTTTVSRVDSWGECADDASAFYTTMEEVLGHLCRDFGDTGDPFGEANKLSNPRWVREAMYTLILEAVRGIVAANMNEQGRAIADDALRAPLVVLVPGAGVGGLLWYLARNVTGIHVVGTECSREFLASSAFVLSSPLEEQITPTTIFPWASSFGNVVAGDDFDQFAPCSLSHGHYLPNMELVYADVFANRRKGFNKKGTNTGVDDGETDKRPRADILVTMYTIDALSTRHRSLLEVLDRIEEMVVDGGCWINLGPLVYHTAEAAPKLSAEEIVLYMKDVHGFVDDVQPLIEIPPMAYARPQYTSMAATHHAAVFFVLCKKVQDESKR